MDFVIDVDAKPLAGETVLGKGVTLIPGGKVSVGKGHDRIGKTAEHPPDDSDGGIIFHGKLRDGDKYAGKQDDRSEYALFFQLFAEYERLYKSQK